MDEQHAALETVELEQQHTSGAYPKRPLTILRGRGSTLWDSSGRPYLDMTSGQGVALLGHSHPTIVQAVTDQAQRLITCPEIFYNDQRSALYQALARHTPQGMTRFFLCNSGAEAVEGALKLARLLTGRTEIVAAQGGFHGRTLGALSVTWKAEYRQPFQPLLPGVTHVPFNDLAAAAHAVRASTAAVIVEVVQGEGGVRPARPEYLHGLQRLCDEHGALLIFDEIQTGLGRTGRWFACQHHSVTPDVLCLGKGIAGGLPMGVVAWQAALGGFRRGSHGSTFGGNPLACAAALATLRVLEQEDLPGQAARLGHWLLDRLLRLRSPLLRQVRGQGLMVGIELRCRVTPLLKALMARGVLALPAGSTVLRLLPSLVVEQAELERVCQAIDESLEELYGD